MRRTLIVLAVLAAPLTHYPGAVASGAKTRQGPLRGYPVAAQDFRDRGSGEDVWKVLAAKYDTNKDGRISAEEYIRGKEKFQALDRNTDGALTAADFAGRGRFRGFGPMLSNRLARAADLDRSGDVTGAEWKTFLASLGADEAGVIDATKLRSRLRAPQAGERPRGGRGRQMPPMMLQAIDRDGDGKIELADLETVFADLDRNKNGAIETAEFGGRISRESAPERGDVAPDFELASAKDTAKTVRLSSFAGKRPVALVFGSYT